MSQFYGPIQRWPGTASMQDLLMPSQAYFNQQLAASAPIAGNPPPGTAAPATGPPRQVPEPRVVVLPAAPVKRSLAPEIWSGVSAVLLVIGIGLAVRWRK